MTRSAIRYQITPINPHAHLFEVVCQVDAPDPAGQCFALPAWIPGSYMIRDFARNIVSIRAESAGKPLAIEQLDKHTWRVQPAKGGAVRVVCEVYAWDLSVRGAHLDATHGFFNGSSVFLRVCGQEHLPCVVEIRRPSGAAFKAWQVATTLPEARGMKGAARRHGFGCYRARDYDTLIDHPVEMGCFTLARFTVCGVPHEVAITGRHDCDTQRLVRDLAPICQAHIELFGAPPPFSRYLFLVTAVGEGYGGLEHCDSTALICSRDDLPGPNTDKVDERYRTFLGLCSHEYFHAWHVKRIKPAAFIPYDLTRENHTPLLWLFEGFTSYYDDLALVRAGVISREDYFELLQKNIANLARTPGRFKQSVAESSFNAWTKYYRQDENSPNAIVSYYLKGGLIALLLDCTLRVQSAGRVSLDHIMRALWDRFGQTGRGVGEDDVLALCEEALGARLGRLYKDAIYGTRELPLADALAPFGLELAHAAARPKPWLGVKFARGAEAKIAHVFDDSPAQRAGLSAHDVIIAVDGLRASPETIDKKLARLAAGARVQVHAFRRDELMHFELQLAPQPPEVTLRLKAKLGAQQRRFLDGWLGGGNKGS